MTQIQKNLSVADNLLSQAKLENQKNCGDKNLYTLALTHSVLAVLISTISEIEVELHEHTLAVKPTE